jgi:N-acetylglucosamine kinase-like BadF-type ATPase
MTRYFLGLDAGGTKSHALVATAAGEVVGFAEAGPGNHESIGYDGLRATLEKAVFESLAAAGVAPQQVEGAGYGLGGYDWPGDEEPTANVVRLLGLGGPFACANDATIALIAGAEAGWGVAIIGGTGCNARGRDLHGHEGRVTGEGPQMGEYGGAGELVGKAIQAVSMAWSKRGPETRLTEMFLEHFGETSVMSLLEGLCRGRYRGRASMAPLVFQVAAEGDAVAKDVIAWAGGGLASLAIGVIHQLGFEDLEFDVVMAGSLFNGGPMLIAPLGEALHAVAPGARLVRLSAPPVVGGVLLGMEQGGLPHDPAVRERLIAGATEALAILKQSAQ